MKIVLLLIVFAVFIILFSQESYALTNINSCQNLNLANEGYNLTVNVSSADYCFHIIANNVTLDGNGYWINYSQSAVGYAINNSGGYDNITIKNLNIVQGNSSVSNAYAIFGNEMGNSSIANNTIKTYSNSSSYIRNYGVWLNSSSNSNTISNNTITTSGASASSPDYLMAIRIEFSSNNNLIQNNNIQTNSQYAHGINLFSYSNSNTVSDNTIVTSGNTASGVVIYYVSDSNTLSNNNIATSGTTSYGIAIQYSSTNNITGGSFISKNSYDYYLQSADTTNNFTNTNFTAQRRIWFVDTSSWFNYNNQTDGNIWLKTNISVGSREIRRMLITWSQSQMKWNDSNFSGSFTANYNLTGLFANTQYNVYNTSAGVQTNPYNLTTDASGSLPSFTLFLIGSTEIKVSEYSPPKWSANTSKLSSPQIYSTGTIYGFQINWTDNNFANTTFQLGRPFGTLTNYTAITTPATQNNSASGKDVWFINFTQTELGEGGTYNITWFGIDTQGAQNRSDTINYIINLQCSSNSTSCITQNYSFSGWIFDSISGNLLGSGTLKLQVKETGDVYSANLSGGYFSISPQFCLVPGKIYTFNMIASSQNKKMFFSYRYPAKTLSENNISCSFSQPSCSFKAYPLSGLALDSKTGSLIQSGTVKVTVSETGDTYSESFSNGYFSINPRFCLTPGKNYNFVLTIEGDGKTGYITYKKSGY